METMMNPTLLADITGIVRRAGKVRRDVEVAPDSRLVEDLAIDSLDLVDIILKVQDQFDIVIDDEDMPNLRRVADLVAYVAAQRDTAAA
jgi:acyl carrier protein